MLTSFNENKMATHGFNLALLQRYLFTRIIDLAAFFAYLVHFWLVRHFVSDHFVGDPVLYCCNHGVVTQVLENGKSY